MRQDRVDRGKAEQSATRYQADTSATDDVRFDMPPRFGGENDRRMARRAEAGWRAALLAPAAMPGHRAIATAGASEFADHALLLDLRRGDRIDVVFAGVAVTAAFGVAPGYLASDGDGGLAALLLDSCELMRLWQ
ncbi:MAG TPA: hypothetical protein PK808_05575, partial [Polymorphobacter sp.]|nr:hypothetical protein [Polymorphobacter sp.]